jgi:hypothetical protein
MEIVFEDAVITPVSDDSPLFDLRFYKNVKKRETGEIVRELGSPLYGLTLYSAIKRIAHFKTSKKYKEAVVELKEYVRELRLEEERLRKYLNEQLPEKFDTGE